MSELLIGQRVIYNGEIVTVIRQPLTARVPSSYDRVWVRRVNGEEHWIARQNAKELPGGQL